jgi:hypothetical protein
MCVYKQTMCMCCKREQNIQRIRDCENFQMCKIKTIVNIPATTICNACAIGRHNLGIPCTPQEAPNVVIMHFNNHRLAEYFLNGVHPV